jgi:hypothetical protein
LSAMTERGAKAMVLKSALRVSLFVIGGLSLPRSPAPSTARRTVIV